MTEITPRLSASLAKEVYALTKLGSLDEAIKELNRKFGDILTFSESALLKAKTGGPWFIKCQTAFGFVLIGKGAFAGHAFFLFRGTQYLADWLTNLNVGLSRSASGQPIHDGFNKAFNTMKATLEEFMRDVLKSNISQIHCIGHSLGGALATICADWIHSSYQIKPYLYTFGSPRVGLVGFSDLCTKRIGAERMYRVYHKTDVVPFIPIWPYIHTPNQGIDYYLPSPGSFPGADYHDMGKYVESVAGKNWAVLSALREPPKTEHSILQWLRSFTPVGLSISAMEFLSSALVYVLKKCVKGVEWLISTTANTTLSLMDRLAYVLNQSIELADSASSLVLLLMRKILQVLGLGHQVEQADLTREFIRTVLIRLQTKANEYTKNALGNALVEGRQI